MSSVAAIRLAATAILLRSGGNGLEVCMVRRNPDLAFGGMWTFPGGAIDPSDGPLPSEVDESSHTWDDPELIRTAARAAARETVEETGLVCDADRLAWFSHWIPPRRPGLKRFATWFFLAGEPTGELVVDPTENSDGRWVTPTEALGSYARGEFPLAVPTWVTLDDLRGFDSPTAAVAAAETAVRLHHTRHVRTEALPVLVWPGDAAHESGDPDTHGPRNRVELSPDGGVRTRTTSG